MIALQGKHGYLQFANNKVLQRGLITCTLVNEGIQTCFTQPVLFPIHVGQDLGQGASPELEESGQEEELSMAYSPYFTGLLGPDLTEALAFLGL